MLEKKDLEQIKEIVQESERNLSEKLYNKIKSEIDFSARITKERFDEVDKGFAEAQKDRESIKSDVSRLKSDVSGLKSDVSGLKSDVSGLKSDMTDVKRTMITKTYFDDQIKNLKGELVLRIKRQDSKFNLLVEVLFDKNIVSKKDIVRIDSLEVASSL